MEYLPKPEQQKIFKSFYAAYLNAPVDLKPVRQMHHLLALTLLYTGARISQALALRGTDIFQWNGKIVLRITAAKGGKERLHDLHVESDPAFDLSPLIELARVKGSARVFGSIDRSNFDKVIKRHARETMLPASVHAHMLRHSAAKIVFEGTNANPGAVTEFLQHSSPNSAMVYLAENNSEKAQAAMNAYRLSA